MRVQSRVSSDARRRAHTLTLVSTLRSVDLVHRTHPAPTRGPSRLSTVLCAAGRDSRDCTRKHCAQGPQVSEGRGANPFARQISERDIPNAEGAAALSTQVLLRDDLEVRGEVAILALFGCVSCPHTATSTSYRGPSTQGQDASYAPPGWSRASHSSQSYPSAVRASPCLRCCVRCVQRPAPLTCTARA